MIKLFCFIRLLLLAASSVIGLTANDTFPDAGKALANRCRKANNRSPVPSPLGKVAPVSETPVTDEAAHEQNA